ncbi:hypothetical protein Y032_0100g3270 [Ancylostoma ceylanicum]|uniref:Uncharacterized protein n=1 Tax=Ancylostoma ceylanicum TaxID=53326 RepID=A0A016THC8_9BILA|nr:hypothetical protein Y032_0100g3270 [Ancylostoma ceylanicum]
MDKLLLKTLAITMHVNKKKISQRLGLHLRQYKYVVQVAIGEQRGQGLNITSQCFWDNDCDGLATYLYHDI